MTEQWKDTTLWRHIEYAGAKGDAARLICQEWLPDIIPILGDTTRLKDFTLHDAAHSYRVAERMADIIPKGVELGVEEYTLLLLSAYLHDIGMIPEQKLIDAVRGFLQGKPTEHHHDEITRLRTWLDDFSPETKVPVTRDNLPDGETSDDAWVEFLTQHFCRVRHCDLAERWIEKHQPKSSLYTGWAKDLKSLCSSHHWDRDGLCRLDLSFATDGRKVNLRYLAVILRVADVMDVDERRVPAILYESRNVALPSRVYWEKDHGVKVKIEQAEPGHVRKVSFIARPDTAQAHHACRETAAQITAELALADTLAQTGELAPGAPEEHGRCRWDLAKGVTERITPDGGYTYIDGAFRPNTKRVLEMLGGLELYEEPLAAVRELVQNAFDAVRFTIAEKMLEKARRDGARFDPETRRAKVADDFHVDLILEERDGRWWLACRDDGRGMTRAVIEKRLLVSGAGQGHKERQLERQCGELGFSAELTGTFGIGVLSYFMLADRVEFRSQPREGENGNTQGGWNFVTEGIGSFGELRPWNGDLDGARTEVALRLREKVIGGDPDGWFEQLRDYLTDLLVRVPCHVTLRRQGKDEPALSFAPGWTWDEDSIRSWISHNLIPFQTRQERTHAETGLGDDGPARRRAAAAAEALCFPASHRQEGEITAELAGKTIVLGRYRLIFPAYATPHGPAPVSIDAETGRYASATITRWGWKGIRAGMRNQNDPSQVLAQVDLWNPECGILPASRAAIWPSEILKQALDQVRERAKAYWADLAHGAPEPLREIAAAWAMTCGSAPDRLPPAQPGALWPIKGEWLPLPLPYYWSRFC
jgi:hypothetical protein